jgi:branched-chain amino acid transport system substrate-binding protein
MPPSPIADKGETMGRPTRLFAALVCTTLLAACGAGSEDTGGNTAAGGEEKAGGSGDPILIGIGVAQTSPVAVVAPLAVEQALAMDPAIETVAVAYAQNDAFSASETTTFQETVKAKGLTLATVQTFQTSDTDFTAQANAMLGKKPQLIIVSGLAADGGNLVKQLRELGYTGLIIGGNGLNTTNVFPVCAKACDGVLIAQA